MATSLMSADEVRRVTEALALVQSARRRPWGVPPEARAAYAELGEAARTLQLVLGNAPEQPRLSLRREACRV